MKLNADLPPKHAPDRPVVPPAVACQRVLLEAQRIAQQVAQSRASA